MEINAVLNRYLRELEQPAINIYELCMSVFNFHQTKKYLGKAIEINSQFLLLDEIIRDIIQPLIESGTILEQKDFAKMYVFEIVGNKPNDIGDIACSVDPFCYISHLSAMAYYGLTNRLPKILFITTPPPKDWKIFAAEKMKKDCKGFINDYLKSDLPKLTNIRFEKIHNNKINRHASVHQGAFKKLEGRKLRVATMGRTFLDMLREPELCGGMRHIIEVFIQFGLTYKRLIIDEIDRHGKLIEKTRAGYLLETYCSINDEKINNWAKSVQRGGSRKLDPSGAYREVYSDRWCLSINVD